MILIMPSSLICESSKVRLDFVSMKTEKKMLTEIKVNVLLPKLSFYVEKQAR